MGYNPSRSAKGTDCPVDGISHSDAVKFCELAATTTEQSIRLPTEAEWEYACRAGSSARWFFGDNPSVLGDYAWNKGNAGKKSHPVGKKKPNPWGLYDMYGNVCERIADVYATNFYAKSPKQDPFCSGQSDKSVFKVIQALELNLPGHWIIKIKLFRCCLHFTTKSTTLPRVSTGKPYMQSCV
jgi:formylglycine-generating enzyme required for sulfatase activity